MLLLKSRFRVTERYRSKSKIEFWENLDVNDVVEITAVVRKDYMVPTIYLYNERVGSIQTTFNILSTYLSKLGYVELDHGWRMSNASGVYRGLKWAVVQSDGTYSHTILSPEGKVEGAFGNQFSSLESLKEFVDSHIDDPGQRKLWGLE